jgi:hypothetical protein
MGSECMNCIELITNRAGLGIIDVKPSGSLVAS